MDWFRRFTRLFRIQLVARRRPRVDIGTEVATTHDRVWLTDLDELRHMNNGVYLSLLDHARLDLMLRSSVWQRLRAAKVYPVVTAQTVTYRKSLELGQRFDIETRIAGYDDRAVFIEQRFVVGGEIYARAFVEGRFLRMSGGVVPVEEVGRIVGVDTSQHRAPAWLTEWSRAVRLPSTREPAPSVWD